MQAIFIRSPCAKQVMMFSATLNKDLRTVCKRFMSDVNIFSDLVFFVLVLKVSVVDGLGLKSIIFNICIHYSRFPRRVLHHENSSMTFYLEMKVFLVHAVSI